MYTYRCPDGHTSHTAAANPHSTDCVTCGQHAECVDPHTDVLARFNAEAARAHALANTGQRTGARRITGQLDW